MALQIVPRWLRLLLVIHGWHNTAITLIEPDFGQQTAQACVNTRFRQLASGL